MCIYVFMHGVLIEERYSYNKQVNTLYTVVVSPSYIPPKCAKTREHEDKHCVSWCTRISYNICNPIPLDNLKNHTALPYITVRIGGFKVLGYYKIKQGILQQNLTKYYRFERAEKLCEYFKNFVNTLRKERVQKLLEEIYP